MEKHKSVLNKMSEKLREKKEVTALFEQKKFCPVCGGLTAVLNGNPEKYGKKAVPWHTFIRVKYCSDECRGIMKGQSTLCSNRRRRRERREQCEVLLDVVGAYREESRLLRARIAELEMMKNEADFSADVPACLRERTRTGHRPPA